MVRVADYLVANRLSGMEQDVDLVTKTAMVNETSDRNGTGAAAVCQASQLIEADENYQERVGLLEAVRLYDQGFLRL